MFINLSGTVIKPLTVDSLDIIRIGPEISALESNQSCSIVGLSQIEEGKESF